MVDPNQAYKKKKKPNSTDTKDVSRLHSMLGTCATCGRPMVVEVRGINTLYLPDVRCGICKKGG